MIWSGRAAQNAEIPVFSIGLDAGWYGFGYTGGAIHYLCLGIVRLHWCIPALDRVIAQEVNVARTYGRRSEDRSGHG